MKLLFSSEDGRVLGAQAVGEDGVERRIDVIAMAIQKGATIADLEEAELCYAPQFGGAKIRSISPAWLQATSVAVTFRWPAGNRCQKRRRCCSTCANLRNLRMDTSKERSTFRCRSCERASPRYQPIAKSGYIAPRANAPTMHYASSGSTGTLASGIFPADSQRTSNSSRSCRKPRRSALENEN